MRVYAATGNAGKLREFCATFAPYGWEVVEYEGYCAPDEGDESYERNALAKAQALHEQLLASGRDAATLGDDSGLEVRALDERPGIHSARYGGGELDWAGKRRRLLDELHATLGAARAARFVCALCLIGRDGTPLTVRGSIEGRIAESERGAGGFSYDALFELPDGRTFAEIPAAEKIRISHRGQAAIALLRLLESNGRGDRI